MWLPQRIFSCLIKIHTVASPLFNIQQRHRTKITTVSAGKKRISHSVHLFSTFNPQPQRTFLSPIAGTWFLQDYFFFFFFLSFFWEREKCYSQKKQLRWTLGSNKVSKAPKSAAWFSLTLWLMTVLMSFRVQTSSANHTVCRNTFEIFCHIKMSWRYLVADPEILNAECFLDNYCYNYFSEREKYIKYAVYPIYTFGQTS